MSAPTIETEHLILRPFLAEDADAYYEAVLSDPVTTRAIPTGRPVPPQRVPSIIENYKDQWDEWGYGLWAVILREDGQLIGHCGLQRLGDTQYVELTYAIKHPYVTGDLPVEAANASLRYAFEILKMPEVYGLILPENGPARRVYDRVGMKPGPALHAYGQRLGSYRILQGDFYPDDTHFTVRKGTA
ncbi:MAG TPA: GNAT family N-acetyltransferase [Spirillospora sp.]|jgi:ribosomal-protein-alanine N-acetyltransferase|nr:GNAT family N-acetyltransferase [Spirillospora sp.]